MELGNFIKFEMCLKLPVIIIMEFGVNNVLWQKSIDINISTLHFFVYYKKKLKSTRAWPILKSNSTLFWFNLFPLGWIIKKLRNGDPKYLRKEGAMRRCNWATMSWIAPCDTPHTAWIISLPLRKGGTQCQN